MKLYGTTTTSWKRFDIWPQNFWASYTTFQKRVMFTPLRWFPSGCVFPYEKSCYLMQQPRYGQVLTGILPYNRGDHDTIAEDIKSGVRPSRPAGLRRNRRLQDPVWDVIVTGWSHQPEQRCELSVMHNVFWTYGQQEFQDAKLGNLSPQNNRNLVTTERLKHSSRATTNWKNPPTDHLSLSVSARFRTGN